MYKGNSIGVVIPAYNESGLVGEVIGTLPEFVDRAYVVDDCSTDDTWTEIRTAAAQANATKGTPVIADGGVRQDRIVPMRHEENRGVGGAIKTGYLAAREDGIDVVTVMGGDGQMDPAILDRIVDPVATGRADYAKGNRLLRAGDVAGMPSHRVVGNYILTLLTRVASGYWTVGDPQNGYAAISRAGLHDADAAEMYEFYGYCNDLLVKLNVADARVADVPMAAKYAEETSHIELTSYVPRVSGMLARNFGWRLRRKYLARGAPGVPLLYGLGVLTAAAGVLALVATAVGFLSAAMVAALLLVVGLTGVFAGAALDQRKNRHLDFVVSE